MDLSAKDSDKYRMVDVIKERLDVTFNEPSGPAEIPLQLRKRRVTAPIRPKAVGVIGECRLVDSFQQHPHYFLHQFVIKGRDAQRAQFPILFLDIGAARGVRLVAVVTVFERVNFLLTNYE